jgi:DNA-binding transcriptional MerR regulator
MSDIEYDIQTLVELSGVPRRTIYFYTQQAIIPPPSGAGLAARYSDIHLLRMRLIPLLRSQGLRLDDIRRRLEGLDVEGLRQQLNEARPAAAFTIPEPAPALSLRAENVGRRFIHYPLPAGLTLIAPADLLPEEQHGVNQLLLAAQRLLTPGIVRDLDISSHKNKTGNGKEE